VYSVPAAAGLGEFTLLITKRHLDGWLDNPEFRDLIKDVKKRSERANHRSRI
jgi:hypothetical protein